MDILENYAENKLNEIVTLNVERTQLIVRAIEAMLDNNRNILVLSDRKDLLKSISLLLAGKDFGWAIGGKKDTDHKIILGTYQVAGLGLDIPELDTLIFATPRTDIEQAVGRIVRKVKGKKRPYVIDIVDVKSSIITKYYYVRRNFYNKVNARIAGSI